MGVRGQFLERPAEASAEHGGESVRLPPGGTVVDKDHDALSRLIAETGVLRNAHGAQPCNINPVDRSSLDLPCENPGACTLVGAIAQPAWANREAVAGLVE